MTSATTPAPLMDSTPVSKWLDISPNALAKMRMDGTGPAFIKIGSRIKYHPDDVAEWIASNRHTTTDDYAA